MALCTAKFIKGGENIKLKNKNSICHEEKKRKYLCQADKASKFNYFLSKFSA